MHRLSLDRLEPRAVLQSPLLHGVFAPRWLEVVPEAVWPDSKPEQLGLKPGSTYQHCDVAELNLPVLQCPHLYSGILETFSSCAVDAKIR